jgi:hypothetical protein
MYEQENAEIARIMGWQNDGNHFWCTKDQRVFATNRFCEQNDLAAEFRQHTMRQEWCDVIHLNWNRLTKSWWAEVVSEFRRSLGDAEADTEASASSLACLAAWKSQSPEEGKDG